MMILTDADKALDKIQHPFMTKKLEIEGNFILTLKQPQKPTINVLDGERLLPETGNSVRMSTLMPII